MPIPNFQKIFLPLLKETNIEDEISMNSAIEKVEDFFELTEEERKRLLPSGNAIIFKNRVRFARLYLIKAGLIESKRRGYINITLKGKEVLKSNPKEINLKYLEQFPEYLEFKNKLKKNQEEKRKNKKDSNAELINNTELDNEQTTEETLEYAFDKLQKETASDLSEKINNCTWSFFEKLVIDLLLKMGYGGSRKDAGQAFTKSNDEGIDGIIKEDKLGLDIIYVQAKKWQKGNTVGRPEIQKFAGALQGQRAKKGIFITTSNFSKGAYEYTKVIDSKIVLIDGIELAELMMANNLGVSTENIYELKKVDTDYFIEE